MKTSIVMLSLVLSQVFASYASAALISRNYRYIHHGNGMQIELNDINEQEGTAYYWDYESHKKVTVKLSEVSRETDEALNGVRPGKFMLVNFGKEGIKTCETYRVFENSQARIGCQSGKIRKNIGVDRPLMYQYNVDVNDVMAEVESLDGFSRKDKVILTADANSLECGAKVRIEAIFPNGEALVQRMGANLLDTSSILMKKSNVERVSLRDLQK